MHLSTLRQSFPKSCVLMLAIFRDQSSERGMDFLPGHRELCELAGD